MSEKSDRRPELVVVAMTWDDLWLGAIYLSNPEIAGSPRKVYRDRACDKHGGGRVTEWDNEGNRVISTKLRITP